LYQPLENNTTPVDALGLADAALNATPAQINGSGMGVCPLCTGGAKHGEAVSISWLLIKDSQWYPIAFAQTELMRVKHHPAEKIIVNGVRESSCEKMRKVVKTVAYIPCGKPPLLTEN
jgi:hypothetical protein